MKRRYVFLTSALVVVLGMVLLVPGASAQNSARADIPFAFSANHQEFPAGCYQVKLLSNAILGMVNCETGETAGMMIVHTANGYPAIQNGSLVFQITGHKYRLIQVRFAGINIQSDLSIQPNLEKELAGNKDGKTTEIAMK